MVPYAHYKEEKQFIKRIHKEERVGREGYLSRTSVLLPVPFGMLSSPSASSAYNASSTSKYVHHPQAQTRRAAQALAKGRKELKKEDTEGGRTDKKEGYPTCRARRYYSRSRSGRCPHPQPPLRKALPPPPSKCIQRRKHARTAHALVTRGNRSL